jgi:putative endonuclease
LKHGEIDIVAQDGESLVIVEVRLRRGASAGEALESVAYRKQTRLRRLATEYCVSLARPPTSVRIDVIAIAVDRTGSPTEVLLVQNAVEDE